MAYTAAVNLNHYFMFALKYADLQLPPGVLKIVEFAHKELNWFQNFVEKLDGRSRKRMKASLARIGDELRQYREVLYCVKMDTEDEVEDFSRGVHSLVEKLKKVEEEYHSLPLPQDDDEEPLSSSRLVSKSKIVGLCDVRSRLKQELVTDAYDTSFFSLLGMPGIGKTTLAREIFEDLDISEWFDCRAWVTAGANNEWKLEELQQVILAQLDPMYTGSLSEILEDKRFLIVLDDLWDNRVLLNLKMALPDYKDGSRVLFTSTIRFTYNRFPIRFFHVRLLNRDESWDLLCEKAFHGDSCPPQLVDVGKKIADKCDGLPLTILTVVDLLTKVPESLWIHVAQQRKHPLFIHAYDKISKVKSQGYKKLRDDLKLCFLYMGVVPLKHEMSRSKLTNLWIAEEIGIDKPFIEHSLEFAAIDSLQNLYFRSLVMVTQKSTSCFHERLYEERIKTCRLHSSWWHFCQREARNINFFHVVDCPEDGLVRGIERQSKLSIHNNVLFARKDVYSSMEKKCASTAQSLLCFGPYHPYQVPICFGLKLLQRLDALIIRFYDFPLELVELVMLKYLALATNRKLPPSISKLQKLQYLIVHPHLSIKSCEILSNLPKEIWDMKMLKHLQVIGCDLLDLGDTTLHELSTLSGVTIGIFSVLKRVPNLVKLGIKIELKSDAPEPLCHFGLISNLEKLESFTCVIVNPECKFEIVSPIAPLPCLPSSLKKLSLSGLGYPWEEMSKIASLPNLEVLKLRYNAFRGPKWEVEVDGFLKLCCLVIEDIDLVKLTWAHGSFKNLEILRMEHCYNLKELQLGDVKKIWKVEVVDCNPLVEMKIKEPMMQLQFLPRQLRVHYSWKS